MPIKRRRDRKAAFVSLSSFCVVTVSARNITSLAIAPIPTSARLWKLSGSAERGHTISTMSTWICGATS